MRFIKAKKDNIFNNYKKQKSQNRIMEAVNLQPPFSTQKPMIVRATI